jgi:hypothetical protein
LYLTPLPTTLSVPEAAYMIENCEAKLVIARAALRSLAESLPDAGVRPIT